MGEGTTEQNEAFVIMALTPAHCGIYEGAIKPAFEEDLKWKCYHLDELSGAGNKVRQMVESIAQATLIIADLTALPSEVMYELGMAHALSNNVLTLIQKGGPEVPSELRTYRCIEYENTIPGGNALRQRIVREVQALPEWSEKPSNPVQEYLPSERRYVAPDSLVDQQVAQNILAEQKKMQQDIATMLQQMKTLQESVHPSARVDPGLLDRKINELRANLNDMIRKHSEAENYLRRLANERDVILEQTVQISMILEERQTAITHPQDQAELLFVPAGLIVPGRPRLSAEEQQRDMRFVRSFYLDKYPVTNAQFVRFVEATGYKTIAERLNLQEGCNDPTWCTPNGHGSTLEGRENHPVVWVYREDARRYAEWAGRRLPTRLEWERAMRGLEGYTWPWGNEWRDNVCNLNREGTTPVDAFPAGASPVGCLDMVGNVWEWLSDELAGGKLLLMGGSWAEERKRMGTGYKGLVFPRDGTDGATGFRCAMDVPGGSDGSDE